MQSVVTALESLEIATKLVVKDFFGLGASGVSRDVEIELVATDVVGIVVDDFAEQSPVMKCIGLLMLLDDFVGRASEDVANTDFALLVHD